MSEIYYRTALFRDNAPLSCANATDISGFEIEGTEPTGTDRRVLFSYFGDNAGAEYFKLAVAGDGTATVQPVATQNITPESVLAEGNTVSDLLAVKSIPEWAGQIVYPVVALSAPETQSAVPTLKLGIVTESSTAVYEHYEESAVMELATEDVDIISVQADTTVTGNGSITVEARVLKNATWGEYTNLNAIKNIKAAAIQFRARYVVGKLDGTDSAKVDSVSMVYSDSNAKLSGETTELFFVTKNFSEKGANSLVFAQCMVRHKKLQDAGLRAFVSFRSEVQERSMYPIGTGTGERQTISLPDTGIAYNTVAIQVNGEKVTGYSVNTETNEISITADKGMAITASYQYGWEDEEYTEMPLVSRQAYDETGTEFASKYQLAVSDSDTNKTVTCIKFSLDRTEGDVTEKTLAVATGDVQVFQLDHYARKDTIQCTGAWTYDEASRILKVQHTKGENIVISYHYVSESHEVYAAAAGWAKAA